MARFPKTTRNGKSSQTAPQTPAASSSRRRGGKAKQKVADEATVPCLATYVVALDLGTTFSGVAFAKLADIQSDASTDPVVLYDNWPAQGEAGAKAYCKTQTSVWYMPGRTPETFELKGWGWRGFVDYRKVCQGLKVSSRSDELNSSSIGRQSYDHHERDPRSLGTCKPTRQSNKLAEKIGYFLTKFKLGLAGEPLDLPHGLSLERVISDYLRELTDIVLAELHKRYGNDLRSHRDVQYILTVPAMWTAKARDTMQECAEMAGMVEGPFNLCDDDSASLHDLLIVTEPEAAAVHVHKTLKTTHFRIRDKFLVVDVGGGTTDIVVHEKIGNSTKSRSNIRVKEVCASKGGRVGGNDVDDRFFDYLRSKIGCLSAFATAYPIHVLEISRWWSDFKVSFDGRPNTYALPIPAKLGREWKAFDAKNGQVRRDDYDYLCFNSSDVKKVFDPVAKLIIKLIDQQVVPNLRAILVVGGFSESPYLGKMIREAFKGKAEEVIFTPNGGAAVLRGALSYGVMKEWNDMVNTRISPQTFGFDTTEWFIRGEHREDYLVLDQDDSEEPELCDNIFGLIMRRGDEVPPNHVFTKTLHTLYRRGTEDGNRIEINLYSTEAKQPRYVTDKGVKKLGTCFIWVPKREDWQEGHTIELSVRFGTLMRFSVQGKNFAGEKIVMDPIRVKWAPRIDYTRQMVYK